MAGLRNSCAAISLFDAPPAARPATRASWGVRSKVVSGVRAGLPPRQHVIVADAYTAVFLPEQRRAELAGLLAEAGQRRPVTWLSLDPLVPLGPAGRDSVQGLPLPPALIRDYQHGGIFAVLGARTFDGASDRSRLLARAHPSGQWIEWLSH